MSESVKKPGMGGKWFTEMSMGKNITNYDSMLVLTHFKGHTMGGFGGSNKNIGILASTDILVIDQASVDLIYALSPDDRKALVERMETRHGLRQLSYMKELGMGNDRYQLLNLDNDNAVINLRFVLPAGRPSAAPAGFFNSANRRFKRGARNGTASSLEIRAFLCFT